MEITRRSLLVLTGTFMLAGCTHEAEPEGAVAHARGAVDAGPIAGYSAAGVYDRFRTSHRFFIVRRENQLVAESALCTHRTCMLKGDADGFECPCHGSTFTLDGKVTRGPARRNLPRFAVERREDGHLIVHLDRPLSAGAPDSILTIS